MQRYTEHSRPVSLILLAPHWGFTTAGTWHAEVHRAQSPRSHESARSSPAGDLFRWLPLECPLSFISPLPGLGYNPCVVAGTKCNKDPWDTGSPFSPSRHFTPYFSYLSPTVSRTHSLRHARTGTHSTNSSCLLLLYTCYPPALGPSCHRHAQIPACVLSR